MECFRNPIVVFGSVLYNILYNIIERFCFIRECRHIWPNYVKTSCIIVLIILSLCFLSNVVCIKASTITTLANEQ